MSSISGSERANRNNEVRQIKEEYEAREVQSSKKKKKEIENLKKAQAAALANVEKTYTENLNESRQASREVMSDRDRKNQEKIEEVRTVFREQLKNKSESAQSRENELAQTLKSSVAKQKEINDAQVQNLKNNLGRELEGERKSFDANISEAKEKSQTGMNRKLGEMRAAHGKELNAVVQGQQERVGKLLSALDETKAQAQSEKNQLKHKTDLEKSRLNDTWKSAYQNQQMTTDDLLTMKSEEMKSNREGMKNSFETKLENKISALDKARENLEKQSMERYEKQYRGMESVALREREQRLRDMNQNSQRLDMQRKNLSMHYEDRIQGLETQVKEGAEASKELSSKRIGKALEQNTEILQNLNQRFKGELRETQGRARAGFRSQEQFHRLQNQNLQARNEGRVNRLTQSFNQVQSEMADVQKQRLSHMKENYMDTVGSLREQQQEQLQDVFLTMDERANKTQQKLVNKINEVELMSQKKLSEELKNKDKEMQILARKYETQIKNQEQGHMMKAKNQENRFETKLALIEQAHEKDMEKLQRKHQEQMAALSQRFKSTKA